MMIMEGQAPYTPEEKTEDKKPKKPKFHETTPFWMIIAAIITFLIITVVYYGHYHRYTADNPPELTHGHGPRSGWRCVHCAPMGNC